MKNLKYLLSKLHHIRFNELSVSSFIKVNIFIAISLCLSGCLLTSPFWGQEFTSRDQKIPMQAWTIYDSGTLKFECAKASHAGLYPSTSSVTWLHIQSISPGSASYDSDGQAIYSAGLNRVLPSGCWRQDGAYSDERWFTAIRVTHTTSSGTTTFKVFDKAGLECLGRQNGMLGSWFGWIGKHCTTTYSGSTTDIPYVRISATG